jgi:hypothetical protein
MPNKKNVKWTQGQVRELIADILSFQNDSIQGSISEMVGEEATEGSRLSREQANSLIAIMEPVLKDSAFKVLSSKKF